METLFFTILRMSLSACAVIAAVLLVRLVLTGAPKKWSYLLWSVVGFRLCCPVSFQAAFSLFAVAPTQTQRVEQLFPDAPAAAAPTVETSAVSLPTAAPQISTVHLWPTLGIILWCVGMAAMLIYSLVRILRLRSLLLDAVQLEPGVWQSDRIATPFLMGLIHPKIYIPTETDAETRRYVLAHERVHLQRGDHWIKALSFLLLTVHWFNPLCWLAFLLMNRDMELSCDERVLAEHGAIARSYSLSLLHFATARRFPALEMLAFGESDVKRRVKNALKWKQPKHWVTILAAILCVAAVTACAANPKNDAEREAIRNAAMQASRLSSSQSCIVDSNGELLPGIVELYEAQLRDTFTEDSGYINQYTESMRSIVSSFDDTTDVVLDHQIMEFKVRKLNVDGDQATLVCKVRSLQKYIPHREDGGYDVIFAASKETVTYTLEKSGGNWRVQSFTSENYTFGTPLEMGILGNYKEKTFPTREEACQYAASVGPNAQEDISESVALQRMLNLGAEEIQDFAGRSSPENLPSYAKVLAAAIRNAAANGNPVPEESNSTMPWYWADLYLPGSGTGTEVIHLQEDTTVPVIHVEYTNRETQITERIRLSDGTLYWLIRNNSSRSERVMTSELVPYWDTIHSLAAATVQRIDGLTGYDLTNFYQVDSFTDDVFQYDVYYWSAAYKTDDPYALNWAGQMGLDSEGRVIGLNEPENTFVVRSDGATIITGFEMPFDYDDINLSRNREQVRLAFSQGINHP